MKLREVASVRSGLVLARKAAKQESENRYLLLNLRSITPAGEIDQSQLDVFAAEERLRPEYLTHVGDIVVRMSIPYTAVLIDKTTEGLVISSNFVVIRCDRRHVLPEYLVWLLNTPGFKRRIYENTGGNMMGSVKAGYYSELELPPLVISDQEKLATLAGLARREVRLLRELANEKEKYYAHMMDKLQRQFREEDAI